MDKPRILIVEDDKIISLEIRERLINLGYDIAGIISDGEKAIEQALELIPDLILLDIRLKSSTDGITVAEKVKSKLDIPIIYLTAYTDKEIIDRAKITEPYGYIVKPFDESELHSTIQIALYKHKMENKIIDERERYKSIVEGYDAFTYIINNEMKIEYINKQLTDLSGKNKTGEFCYKSIYKLPKQCPWCTYEAVSNGQTVRIEVQNLDDKKWFYEIATPVNIRNGRINQIRTIFDITEKKLAEQKLKQAIDDKEMMLKEIHHRTKNNLQIMLSLLRLHIKNKNETDAPEVILKSFENRIMSMTLIHELLYTTKDLKKISFKEYITNLTTNLLKVYLYKSDRIKINISTDKILLDADTTIPCGMIINELVSNSLKHGFPDNRRGIINIEMMQTDNQYELRVKDDGIGYPEKMTFNNKSCLGIQIIKTLSAQLGGIPEFKNDKGASFSVLFKNSA